MCGIYGAIFQKPPNAVLLARVQRAMTALAILNRDRGRDATGVAVVQADGTWTRYRRPKDAGRAVQTTAWTGALQAAGPNTTMIMGHTRAGTHGDNTVENAHPFVEGKVIGTHNGVIDNFYTLGGTLHESDSRTAFSLLGKTELAQMPEALAELDGMFALAFTYAGTPCLARNSSAPCWVARVVKPGFGYLYSSEKRTLEVAVAYADLGGPTIYELQPYKLYMFLRDGTHPVTTAFRDGSWQAPGHTPPVKLLAAPTVKRSGGTPGESGKPHPVTIVQHGTERVYQQVPSDSIVHYQTMPCTIVCCICARSKTGGNLRMVNGRSICETCWTSRVPLVSAVTPENNFYRQHYIALSDPMDTAEDYLVQSNATLVAR